jgi:hypothetical protein
MVIREVACIEVLFVPVNKYSYVIINGIPVAARFDTFAV